MKIGIVIPARLESERLPNKVMRKFNEIPMIEHVWKRSQLTTPRIETVIATDNNQISSLCYKMGARILQTSKNHENGLSRVGEAAKKLKWDFYIILQADELLILPSTLNLIAKTIKSKKNIGSFNLITNLKNKHELNDPNVVKCILREDKSIINIFRKTSMTADIDLQLETIKKICGVYAVSHQALTWSLKKPPQTIERLESIEQMKFIELGIVVSSIFTNNSYPSINTLSDAVLAQSILRKDNLQKKITKSYQKNA